LGAHERLFGAQAAAYSAFRPSYPPALFAELARRAPALRDAWDVGAGTGQAALGLAEHFEHVLATDVSAKMLAAAAPHPRITYRHLVDEPRDLADASFELVSVAQALHWFDIPRFYSTVQRVLAPGGLFAAWCYSLLEVEPAFDALVRELHDVTLAPDWPPPRKLVLEGYRSLALPFQEEPFPAFAIERELTLPDVLGYLATWSGLAAHRRRTGFDALQALAPTLASTWGEPTHSRLVRWPLHVRTARRPVLDG
jgi:SAM-dependent methyltransferase